MRAVGVVLSVIAVVVLAWLAGEAHYQGCVAAAVGRTADIRPFPSAQQQLGGAAVPNNGERTNAVAGCSRLPF